MSVDRDFMSKLRKIVENADFDSWHRDISQTNGIGGDKGDFETTNKGRADTKVRGTSARYGDNDMEDDALLDETYNDAGDDDSVTGFDSVQDEFNKSKIPDPKSSIIDKVQAMLQKAGVSDVEMRQGIDLTDAGKQKVAARLGISAKEVPMLLASLSTRLRGDEAHEESAYESVEEDYHSIMNEDDNSTRFGYEKDSLGNVTVTDTQTNKKVYLQGSEATDLLNRLEQSPDAEQDILSGLEPLMEFNDIEHRNHIPLSKEDRVRATLLKTKIEKLRKMVLSTDKETSDAAKFQLDQAKADLALIKSKEIQESKKKLDEDDYIHEMKQKTGTFNFPWYLHGNQGTATARFDFDEDGNMKIKILSIRDNKGKILVSSDSDFEKIEKMAYEFVENEGV